MMAEVSSPTKGEGSPASVWPPVRCTPLCPASKCAYRGQHHALILSLLKCTNGMYPPETGFTRCLDKYKKAKWFLRSPVPEKSEKLQFPLVHWACMLGKYKVLEYLVTERGFDLSVRGGKNQQGALHSLITHVSSCLHPKTSHENAANTFGGVFDVFLKYKTEAIHERDLNSKDTIFHVCAGRCSSDAIASFYLRVMLDKIKECDKISDDKRRDILTAVNTKGDTFLHLLVVDEKSVATLLYVVENFAEICDHMSKTKNNVGKTPRQIAVERQSIAILKALKAPDLVLNSLAKAVKSRKTNVCNNSLKGTLQSKKSRTGTEVQQNASPTVLLGEVSSSVENGAPPQETSSSRSLEQTPELSGDVSDKENSPSRPVENDGHGPANRQDESPSVFEDPATQNGAIEQPSKEESGKGNHCPSEVCKMHMHPVNIKKEAVDPTSPIKDPVTDTSHTFEPQSTALTIEPVGEPPTTAFEQLRTGKSVSSERPLEELRTSPPGAFPAKVKEEPKDVFKSIEVPFTSLETNRGGHKHQGPEAALSQNLASLVADVARQNAAVCSEENPARPSVVEDNVRNVFSAVSSLRKRSAPGTCGVRPPNKKRTRLDTMSSDSESDADIALDDDSDEETDSVEEDAGEIERDEEEDDESQRVAPKHTPFCCKACDVEHHKLLLGLMRCSNYQYGSAYLDTFMAQVNEYVNHQGRFAEARANGDIPDPIASFKYPLAHWACVLGKFKVLERLAENKVFNVAVQSKRSGETGVHRMLMSLDRAMLWKKSPMKVILNVFAKSLRILTDTNPCVLTASDCVGDTPFHCLAKVILHCTGELERLNCYEGYFEHLVRELTRLTATGMLTSSTARELLLKTNKSKETFLHILACRDGVGHRVIKSVLKNIDTDVMEILKETVNGDGKTPSDLAEELCSYDMSAILRPNPPSSPVVDSVQLGDEIVQSPENSSDSVDQPAVINSPPAKLFQQLERPPSPEAPCSGVSTAADSRSLSPNTQMLQFGKFEEELVQARRGLEEKEATLIRVRQLLHNAQEKKKRLLQELEESMEEIAQAAREEGSTVAEIAAKKRDIERITAELAKKAK